MTDRRFVKQHLYDSQGNRLVVECRFCRATEVHDRHYFIAPCQCEEPNKYVHNRCVEQWMRLKFEHVYNHSGNGDDEKFQVCCELCFSKIEMSYKIVRKCIQYS